MNTRFYLLIGIIFLFFTSLTGQQTIDVGINALPIYSFRTIEGRRNNIELTLEKELSNKFALLGVIGTNWYTDHSIAGDGTMVYAPDSSYILTVVQGNTKYSNRLNLSVGLRGYPFNRQSIHRLFGGVALNYSSELRKSNTSNTKSRNLFGFRFDIGYKFLIKDFLILELGIGQIFSHDPAANLESVIWHRDLLYIAKIGYRFNKKQHHEY